ncbi:MAG: SDR family oxidoreductase [Chloroflexales bacterium]|nr:SDR family oxidoreductase [Chloroflexales bacterium]
MRFHDKVVLVVGASGGLGAAIAAAFAAEGAQLVLAARRPETLAPLAARLDATALAADLTDTASLAALRDATLAAHNHLDVVVNATGHDVRKPLTEHTSEDLWRTLDVNLLGAMELTRLFLSVMNDGVILHLGGFADGRLAFPYYSADVASRAGLRAFVESVNRELALEGRRSLVAFFSPSPADTPAERPFHPLWRAMGTAIVPPERVAAEVISAVARRGPFTVMGGPLTTSLRRAQRRRPGAGRRPADAPLRGIDAPRLRRRGAGTTATGQSPWHPAVGEAGAKRYRRLDPGLPAPPCGATARRDCGSEGRHRRRPDRHR